MNHGQFVAGATYFAPLPILGADQATFEILNALYARDATTVYYRYGKIPEANAISFRVLDPGFFRENPEHPPDPGVIHFQGYARDDHNIYHYVDTIGRPSIVRGADLESFEVLQWGFARDRNAVYHERSRVKAAKPDDFRQLSRFFSVSSKAVFYLNAKLETADPASFRILRDALAVDARQVFLNQRIIEGADPASYEVVGISFVGKDRFRAYRHWETIEGADPGSFAAIGGSYQKDRNRVYYQGRPIPDADPDSIQFLHSNQAQDARRLYIAGQAFQKTN